MQFLSQSSSKETREPCIAFWHKSFYDYLTDIEYADSLFSIDQTKGDARLASLFIDHIVALRIEKNSTGESIPAYLRERGLDHLGLSGQYFDRLSEKEITKIAYFSSWRSYGPAVGGLLSFAPAFVSTAIKCNRLDQICRLIDGLVDAARLHYINANLIRIERNSDGTESRILTGEATEGGPLRRALAATEHAIWVADQVLSQHGADPTFFEIMKKFGGMRYMAGGLDIAGWANNLSRYFEDAGGALYRMIANLERGCRAQTWE